MSWWRLVYLLKQDIRKTYVLRQALSDRKGHTETLDMDKGTIYIIVLCGNNSDETREEKPRIDN